MAGTFDSLCQGRGTVETLVAAREDERLAVHLDRHQGGLAAVDLEEVADQTADSGDVVRIAEGGDDHLTTGDARRPGVGVQDRAEVELLLAERFVREAPGGAPGAG